MQAGDDQRGINKTEDCAKDHAEGAGNAGVDDGGNQWGKNLRKHAHDLLQCVLVLLGCALDGILRDTVNAGDGNKVIVEIADRIADDDLELARLGESALGGFQCLDLGNVCLGGIVEDKSHTRYAVGYCRDVLLAANVLKQQSRILFVFTHNVYLLLPGRAGIFKLVHTSFACGFSIVYLFRQVKRIYKKSCSV